jgi:hypothetical protein
MKGLKILRCFTGFIFMVLPYFTRAGVGKPVVNLIIISKIQTDTVAPKATDLDNRGDRPAEDIIREVPKSRRQPVPIPVKIKVIPVNIIKLKIVKPIIKIIH